MLDENLPTFVNKPSSETQSLHVLYLTQNGEEPKPEYILKRPDPSLAASRNKYAVGLVDSYTQDVVYAEVLIVPEWTQPSLSAAEIRAQGGPPPPVPILPETFIIQLYNPDQQVVVRMVSGSWNTRESWEFEMPEQSFRVPSTSRIDREQDDPVASELTPKIMFRWKRDSRLSKDMTCYMTGKSLGKRKSKEPDITIALYKQRRGNETSVTIYEPNMQRVEVEDRKGLDIVLLLGAEVIRDLYVSPRSDIFNVASGPTATGVQPVAAKRKNSRPSANSTPVGSGTAVATMSGAAANVPAAAASPPSRLTKPSASASNMPLSSSPPANDPRTQWEIDAETKRLKALVEKEEREREKRDKAEQKRIKKMLEEEDKERRKREAEVARETERLKKVFGVEGQDFNAGRGSGSSDRRRYSSGMPLQRPPPPQLPPRRPGSTAAPAPTGGANTLSPGPWLGSTVPPPPPRPVSAGPPALGGLAGQFQNCTILNSLVGQGRGHQGQPQSHGGQSGPYVTLPGGSSLALPFLGGSGGRERRKMQKKRSVHF